MLNCHCGDRKERTTLVACLDCISVSKNASAISKYVTYACLGT